MVWIWHDWWLLRVWRMLREPKMIAGARIQDEHTDLESNQFEK